MKTTTFSTFSVSESNLINVKDSISKLNKKAIKLNCELLELKISEPYFKKGKKRNNRFK